MNRVDGMHRAIEYCYKSQLPLTYWEFGVAGGTSLRRAYDAAEHWSRRLRKPPMTFHGFDSFEGLPALQEEDQLDGYTVFQQGQYAAAQDAVRANLETHGVDMNRVTLHRGWFNELSPDKAPAQRPGVVHIDCDLKSSCADVLRFIEPHVADGAVILFDDWFCYRGSPQHGVAGAVNEFEYLSNLEFRDYFTYDWAGRAFIVVRDN